jgi:hypothetical protein
LIVRIRVTQSYFYVLQRAFIRVDDVTIRLRETRLHHVFGSTQSLRQYTEKEEQYSTVKQSCSQKQLAEGFLDDPDSLSAKLQLKLDVTEVFKHSGQASASGDVAASIMKDIAQKNAMAEAAFKKKFGNVKPSAGALLHRQRQHETRYFDSGDAFSGAGKKEDPLEGTAEKRETLAVVQGQLEGADEAAKAAAAGADEIARKNAEAEAAFKKKFGSMKPAAGALLHRQRKQETRYFDSGDAFSGAGKKEDPLETGVEQRETLAVVHGQLDDSEVATEAGEIARKNAAAEAAFKKKFGNAKPSAGALLHRQRKHETRYFDSGEAFSGVSKKEDPLASEDDTQGPLACVRGQ